MKRMALIMRRPEKHKPANGGTRRALLVRFLSELSAANGIRERDEQIQWLLRLEVVKVGLLIFLAMVVAAIVMVQASFLLIPLTLAWLISTLFSPFIAHLARSGIPATLTSALVCFLLVASVMTTLNLGLEPASRWIEELPESLRTLRARISETSGPLSDLQAVSKEVDQLAAMATDDAPNIESAVAKVEVVEPSNSTLKTILTDDLPSLTSGFFIAIAMTFFMLASNGQMLRNLFAVTQTWKTRKRLVRLSRAIKVHLAQYLIAVTTINCFLALTVTVALWLIDVPNPWLWGALAGLLNFAPYVGPAIMTFVLLLVGVTTTESLQSALWAPGVFLIITSIEGQLITPAVIGKTLALSPMMILMAVLLMTWLWGPIGALLAAPLLATAGIMLRNLVRA